MIKAITNCVNQLERPSYLSIITLNKWGGTLIRNDDGSWKSRTDKRLIDSPNRAVLLDLQQLLKERGHIISSHLTSRNMVFENIVLDSDEYSNSYISFRVKKDTKRKFDELCYAKGVDSEKVLNKILESFIKRNTME